jgi:autotransporter-associated beta strand protein
LKKFPAHLLRWTTSLVCWLWLVSAIGQTSQQLYLQCLTNFETYAESIWHTASYSGAPPDSGYWGDGGSTGNGGIRGNSGVAVAYAVLVIAQPSDPRTATRTDRIRQALNYNTATHVTGSYNTAAGNKWGWSGVSSDWQTPEWTASMGLACILVQSNLPSSTVNAVRAGIAPASGYVSDTKAEENGWQGNILALAAAWLNTSNNASTWFSAAKSYLVNTYTVPNTTGDPLAAWVTTQTLYPSYSLENHGFYHPTYEMVAGMSSGDSLLMAKLANTNIAATLLPYADHNCFIVWQTNLAPMLLDSGEFAYPSGLDWELHDYEHNSYVAWIASHFNDPQARWADAKLAQLTRYRQFVNNDGTHNGMFVGPSVNKGSGDPFFREAVEARRTAIAWLHWANADFPSGTSSNPPPSTVHFSDVGVIAQRSAWSTVTISYKNNVMAMIEAAAASVPTNSFITTPAVPGGFGHGPLGNPTSATLVSLTTNSTGFTAQLLVQNGANGSTRVYVTSSGESIGIVEIPFPANGVTGSVAGCFTNGIENDPLTGGSRLIEWTGGSSNVTQFSNVGFNVTNKWICVAGRYGLASGPDSYFRYRSASGYNRAGAAQDFLHVMPKALLAPRYAVWFPGKSAAQTATLANQIAWTTNGTSVILSFPGASNSTQTIIGSLVSGNGTWSTDADGSWSDGAKWSSGAVADGAGNTADFSTLNLSSNRTVALDSSRVIGTLKFGDGSALYDWNLVTSNESTLTLSATTPTVAVYQNSATISVPILGTAGFTKSGSGTLILSGTNSISGTLYTDTGSGSAYEGAVRAASPGALANISAISIRNSSGVSAASTLQLDGSAGSINVSAPITCNCRANTIACIENLAGSNILSGTFNMQTGGSNVVFQCDSGTLTLSGTLQYIGSLTAARTFNFFGDGNTIVNGPISYSSIATLHVGKRDSGTLMLNGANTYLGDTVITDGKVVVNGSVAGKVFLYGGTLTGTGIIAGAVNLSSGCTLASGNENIGPLTINNAVTNNGTLSLRLSKSGSILTNDSLRGVTTMVYGGPLELVSVGDQITIGDTFKLVSASTYRGSFTSISPSTPGVGLLWNTNNLTVDGTISVKLGAIQPQISGVVLSGSDLVWNGTGGAAGATFSILSTTNLATPLATWDVIASGVCDSAGNFVVTNPISNASSQRFYALRIP